LGTESHGKYGKAFDFFLEFRRLGNFVAGLLAMRLSVFAIIGSADRRDSVHHVVRRVVDQPADPPSILVF
jgi:hypothetical protein